jgi:hypothetical protein
MAIIHVPGHWVQPPTTPAWYRSGAYGPPARRYEKEHWVDTRTGRWVPKPTPKPPKPTGTTTTSSSSSSSASAPGSGSPYAIDYADLDRRANAYADSQTAYKSDAIRRAEAAAQAQAQRDAATYRGLGEAQMTMIGKIPENIQAIRNNAAAAIASTSGQVTGAQQQQAQAEQAANAAFAASQTGGTPAAAPAGGAGGAPAPNGPSPGPIGLSASGAAAAEQAMGGTIPAGAQIETGAASAIAASGMPAVVARATQDQVAMRMAQAATEDADYRQQLIDLADQRGGIYQDAYNNLFGIEKDKYGIWEAQQRLTMDQENAKTAAANAKYEQNYKQWQFLQTLKLNGRKLTLAQQKQDAQLAHWLAQEGVAQQNANTSTTRATQNAANYYTDAQGRQVPKGYKYNAAGVLVKTATPTKPKVTKGGGKGVDVANTMAAANRGPVKIIGYDKNDKPVYSRPKVDYGAGFIQIRDRLIGMGYSRAEAEAIAHNAMNAHYGSQFRPGKQRPKKKK